jgi:hypothetical protein
MQDNQIRELIMSKQSNQRISCRTAFEIADEAGVERMKIGKVLNEMDIKIYGCQLGCFK